MTDTPGHAAARRVLDAAVGAAAARGLAMAVAVVDDAAHLVCFQRMDGVILGAVDVAQRKARTAALFRTATADLHPAVAGPGAPLHGIDTTNAGLIVFGGGLPLVRDGHVVGAIGVSGGSADEDAEVAAAGAAGLGSGGPATS